MKKLAAILMSCIMLLGLAAPALASEGGDAIKESASGFWYVEADEASGQIRLSAASKEKFIQADGLYFKDLNGSGALDAYEDWRLEPQARAEDLVSKMSAQEKAGSLFFSAVFGKNGSTVSNLTGDVIGTTEGSSGIPYLDDPERALYSHEIYEVIGNMNVSPMAYQIQDMKVNTFIAAFTGTPKDQLDLFNKIQAIAEDTPLGIPALFSGDRSYDTWGGMIDMAHYATGVSHDPDLLYQLAYMYALEDVALGYHQVFHGYGNEIGSWFGDDPAYIALMSVAETKGYEDAGFQSHSKHFIARGGRSNYAGAHSAADLLDSWMVAWQAVIDAGTQFIMMNKGAGIYGVTEAGQNLQAYTDEITMSYLRDTLGYDGVACLDWPLDIGTLIARPGVTVDGVEVNTLAGDEVYALMLNIGVDMFSALGIIPGTDTDAYSDLGFRRGMPDLVVAALEKGLITEEVLNAHVTRIMRIKLQYGLFDDTYSDWEDALKLIGNETYQADASVIPMTNEEIDGLRNSAIAELERQLMVESTIMLKNDGILPLSAETKVYEDSNNGNIKEAERAALAERMTVVETMEEADVVLVHVTSFDDAYEAMVEDAADAGKPIVLIYEGTVGRSGAQGDPYYTQVCSANAVLTQTYNNTPDHGSSVGSFYRYVTPSITVEMLMGEKDPAGSTVFEIPYTVNDLILSNGELAYDVGMDIRTRLYLTMLAKESPVGLPNNMGEPMYTTDFGMSYAAPADITLSLLSVEQNFRQEVTETNGRTRTTTVVFNEIQKAGVPFEISFVAQNAGGDGTMTVQVMDGDTVAAEAFFGINGGGAWRVITVEVTLEAGEHVLTVGDMSTTITVE